MESGAEMSYFQKGNINSDLESEIINLIELHQEGEYWDFKRQWYDSSKVVDLLHDIICMANNLANHDAYIIIGVDDEDFSLYDVAADHNRRNTQKIVDFLKDKKFAGDIRPIVTVKQAFIKSFTLDVIIIHNSRQTPFYLKENFKNLKASHIYTRIQDSNTPKDKSADIDKVEYLWKKDWVFFKHQLKNLKFI
ncbi:ATP-binding protein [Streptococcus anginosus]|uniref:ATP-binding protein n=1 Tax=Streptococcus anginosus TaxID=1328 RepID=UPI00321C2987